MLLKRNPNHRERNIAERNLHHRAPRSRHEYVAKEIGYPTILEKSWSQPRKKEWHQPTESNSARKGSREKPRMVINFT